MKRYPTKAYSIFCIVVLAALAAACGTRVLPQEATATPTRTATADFITALDLPSTGGEAAMKEPVIQVSPLPVEEAKPQPVEPEPPRPCEGPFGCARLVITQGGQVSQVEWTNGSVATVEAPSILPREQSQDNRWVVDTGLPSPDGKWVAFTSIGYESGGPVFLQQLETGSWTNVIETVNLLLPEGRTPMAEEWMWDVIGWFPDSQRLMIGPYDLSFVMIVDVSTFTARIIPFPSGGKGGRAYVNLSPDGSHFIYVGENGSGAQTLSAYNLVSGDSSLLREIPYAQGILSNPRLSPDGMNLAYMRQNADTSAGFNGEMELFSLETGAVKSLVKGSLWMATPAWSPDGHSLAFTLAEQDFAALAAKDGDPGAARGNVWVVSADDGALKQITTIDGLARSPAWSPDGKSLAFVTHDGQVGLASTEQPGLIRQAAGPSPQRPELTSVYFVP